MPADFNETLIESIDETITDLIGRVVIDALYVHLQKNYSISRDEVPYRLDVLLAILKRLFGESSLTLSKAIAKRFYFKLGLEFTDNPNHTLLEYVDEAKRRKASSK